MARFIRVVYGVTSLLGRGLLIITFYGAITSPYERAANVSTPQQVISILDRDYIGACGLGRSRRGPGKIAS